MKTISPLQLEALIESGEPLELIDVRAPGAFCRAHVFGARSVPFQEAEATHILGTRLLPSDYPLYIMSSTERLARVVAEELEIADCDQAVVVEGGLKQWAAAGLPLKRKYPVILKSTIWIGIGLLLCIGLAFTETMRGVALDVVFILTASILLFRFTKKQSEVETFPLHTGQYDRG